MKKISVILILLLLVNIFSGCGITVPRPEVKNAEFDFSVTYELNGETRTVSGVYVCEYDGVYLALESGYCRGWNGYIKGDEPEEIIIGSTEDGGKIRLALCLYPEYFMNEPQASERSDPEPCLLIDYPYTEGIETTLISDAKTIEEIYGAKIVSYNYSEPIENSFGLFK